MLGGQAQMYVETQVQRSYMKLTILAGGDNSS